MTNPDILQQIAAIIADARRILITGQGDPDGDSLGAELALYNIIMQQRQQTTLPEIVICNDEPTPAQYAFLPNIGRIQPLDAIAGRRFDAGFVVDAGTDRIGAVLPVLQTCPHIINIDHHRSRAHGIETLAWIEPDTCAVCEMLFAFFEHPRWQLTLTPEIAACLYAGIIYDTGAFRYPNTTPRTLQIAAQLLAAGIDLAEITEHLFLEKSLAAIRLLTAVLESLQIDATGAIIWGKLTPAMLERTGATWDDEEGLITQFAFTRGTKVAALLKEYDTQEIKVSFRARGAIDVGAFAKRLSTMGGGHARAAGCTLRMTLDEAEQKVVSGLQAALGHSA